MIEYGVIGGTFDPIHMGHLFIAEEVRTKFELDRILFVPNGNPPHKSYTTDKSIRYKMVELAISDNPYFEISDIEMDTNGEAYTVDTIEKLKALDPQNKYKFIFGADSLLNLHKWKSYEKLIKENEFIAIGRPGFDITEIMIPKFYLQNIEILSTIELEINSTDIRRRIKAGESIRYLVKSEVEDYIYERGLYA